MYRCVEEKCKFTYNSRAQLMTECKCVLKKLQTRKFEKYYTYMYM